MNEPVLETERLVLRVPAEGDPEAQFRLLNTPALMARLGGLKTLEQIALRHVQARDSFAREGFGFMMMIEKASGELVGHCGLKRVNNPLAPNLGDHEVGWLVREDRWRRGYAREATRAVLDWAFGSIDAPHVVALTSETNRASWGLMEKLGMERRPELDFADPDYPPEDNPTIQYRLTAASWRAGQGAGR
jgi:RimJ/RimL family protein N-acetyltransferase